MAANFWGGRVPHERLLWSASNCSRLGLLLFLVIDYCDRRGNLDLGVVMSQEPRSNLWFGSIPNHQDSKKQDKQVRSKTKAFVVLYSWCTTPWRSKKTVTSVITLSFCFELACPLFWILVIRDASKSKTRPWFSGHYHTQIQISSPVTMALFVKLFSL